MNSSFPHNLQYLSLNLKSCHNIKESSVINFLKCLKTNVEELQTFRLNLENFPNTTEETLKKMSQYFSNYKTI